MQQRSETQTAEEAGTPGEVEPEPDKEGAGRTVGSGPDPESEVKRLRKVTAWLSQEIERRKKRKKPSAKQAKRGKDIVKMFGRKSLQQLVAIRAKQVRQVKCVLNSLKGFSQNRYPCSK